MSKKRKKAEKPRIALRPDVNGALDDVCVLDVSMFRLERMDNDQWWMCCYLADHPDDRVNFWISRIGKSIQITVNEPLPDVSLEPGSLEGP